MFRRFFRRKISHSIQSNPLNVNIPEKEKMYIVIADQAYKTNRQSYINGYIYQSRYSNITTAVYFNPNNKHLIIGYRGTKNITDIITDIELAQHKENQSNRFIKDLEEFNTITNAFQYTNLTLTGHSLGGAVCLYINDNTNKVNEVYIINPAFNLNNIFNSHTLKKNNVIILRTKNDLVSLGSVFSGYKVKTIPSSNNRGIFAGHTINNFFSK